MAVQFLDALTVSGSVSSNSIIYGDGSGLTNVLPLSGGQLTGFAGLSGDNAHFNYFYGDGTFVTNVTGIDPSKLSLTGGTLTGLLSGKNAIFDGLSASSIVLNGSPLGSASDLAALLRGAELDVLSLKAGGVIATNQISAKNLFVDNATVYNNLSTYALHTDIIVGNVTVVGNLTATGTTTFNNTTVFTNTSSLSVINLGDGPALYVQQGLGPGNIASFYDADGIEALHVGNAKFTNGTIPAGVIGINTSAPNKTLTVIGTVSATDNVYFDKQITTSDVSISNSVSASYGVFSQYVNAASLSGTHYGDGSHLDGVLSSAVYQPKIASVEATVNSLSARWNTTYALVTALNISSKQVALIGDGINRIFSISHTISSIDRVVNIYDNSSGQTVIPTIANKDPYITVVSFSFIPTTNAYKAVIIG